MSAADQALYDTLARTLITPSQRALTFIGDAEALRRLDEISIERLELDKQDLVLTGGDIDEVGTSFQSMPFNGKDKVLLAVLQLIAQKFPSEEEQHLMAIPVPGKATGME